MAKWRIHYNNGLLDENPRIIRILASTDAYNRVLSNIPLPPHKRGEMMRIAVLKQVHSTTAIEGNQLTPKQMGELTDSDEHKTHDELEAINMIKAVAFICEKANNDTEILIDVELIKMLHEIITASSFENDNIPGEYRRCSVRVGKGDSRFEPVDFDEVNERVNEFVDYINSPKAISLGPLVRAVLAHFYLVTIHPFADGNGRVSRALEAFILYAGGYAPLNHFSISNYYLTNYRKYFSELNDARFKHKGNLEHFVEFALGGFLAEVEQAVDDCMEFIKHKLFYDYVTERRRYDDINNRGFILADMIIRGEIVTKNDIFCDTSPVVNELFKGVGKRTRERDLKKLFEHDLVKWEDEALRPNYEVMNRFRP